MSADFAIILRLLIDNHVNFVVIGGFAAISQGSAYITRDIDICYERSDLNLERLASVLKELDAYPRNAPSGLPFKLDAKTLKMGLNFTFDTKYGPLDALGEVSGVGGYQEAIADANSGVVAGISTKILSLDKLIASKRAAGRPKDLTALVELELIKRAREKLTDGSQ